MASFGCDSGKLMTPEDLVQGTKIACISSLKALSSPSSPSLAFTLGGFSIKDKASTHNIFLYHHDSRRTTQMTRNLTGKSTLEPQLSVGDYPGAMEDTMLYTKAGQIWQMPINGGEGVQVTNFSLSVEAYRMFMGPGFQPWLLVALDVFGSMTPAETVAHDASTAAVGTTGEVYDKLMVRHWDRWGAYKKRNHVFLCPLEITSAGLLLAKEENLLDLMFGLESDCPGKAVGHGVEDFNVSPDGQHIAISCRRTIEESPEKKFEQRKDFAWSTDVSIYLANVSSDLVVHQQRIASKSHHLRMVSNPETYTAHGSPAFSPDSSKLAYLCMARAQYESDKMALEIVDVASGSRVNVTERSLDLSLGGIEWGENNSVIYTTAQHRAINKIFRLNLTYSSEGETQQELVSLSSVEVMLGDESRSSPLFQINPYSSDVKSSKLLFFLESSLTKPNEIKVAHLGGDSTAESVFVPFVESTLVAGPSPLMQLPPSVSQHLVEVSVPCPEFSNGDMALPEVENHYFLGGGGDLVQAWYLPPVLQNTTTTTQKESESETKVPLVLIIHGGPQGAIFNGWNYRWNLTSHAVRGYGVLAVNFHGSTGFGQAFCDSIRGDWGGKPYEDLMAGVDYILNRYSYLDGTRVGAAGASYGGFMINWINGHTDRFKCLVNHDGIFSLRSLYYSTEELWFPEWEFGLPWEQPDVYARWSPESYISEWKTPCLVVQGGKDYRVVETEGLATFTALQRKGIESKLLFFPDENHWVLRPFNSVKWHQTVFAWLDQFLK